MEVPVWTKPALCGVVIGAIGISVVGFASFVPWVARADACSDKRHCSKAG
jgi:hypothetical protein